MHKRLKILFILSIIAILPMSILIAKQTSYMVPFLASVTSLLLFTNRTIRRIVRLDYKNLTTNSVIILSIVSLLLISYVIDNGYVEGEVLHVLYGLAYALFVIYMWIIQDLEYKCTKYRHFILYPNTF